MIRSSAIKKIAACCAAAVAAAGIIALSFYCGYSYRDSVITEGGDTLEWLAEIINNYYYQDVSTEDLYEYSAKAFVSEYLDEYSAYYTAEEYQAVVSSNSGSKSGIGITFSYVPTKGILVNSVVFNSPAYNSGLRSGDYIVSATLNGDTTAFTSLSQFSSYTSALQEGESVWLNTADSSYEVQKSSYTASYVTCATNSSSWAFLSEGTDATSLYETQTDAIEYLPDGVGYISLSQFYGYAAKEFAQAVAVLNEQNCTSVILDLRNNGGGYVSVMQKIASCFTSANTSSDVVAMTAKYKSGSEENFYTDAGYVTSQSNVVGSDVDVYVLANGSTASASEALIGVLISYGIIDYSDIYLSDYSEEYLELTGYTAETAKSARTYGKGIMQTTYVNSSTGEALKLTTAQIYWPNGLTIHGTGITAADGANAVSSPCPASGDGEELKNAVSIIFGS
ncbi:MAG: S41 family peptidase [Clostridia bacterium]|nr:S41 family peptidase [Clostridia bacterium]